MLESMEKLILDLDMIPPAGTVLCAVSGGVDSLCLLHALYQLRPKLGFQLAAAHYNHQLRGAESDGDAAFVAQFVRLCCGPQLLPGGGRLPAVPLYSGSGDVAAQAKVRGTGLEETARDMRYAFLRRAAQEAGAAVIATAHTADDNVETILFHLARGSGLRGLTGIQPVRGDLIRPLLTTTRRELEAYLFYYGLPHREDHTNSDDAFARNRIRHQVVPVLEDLYPGFSARMSDTAALLRADEDYLTQQAQILSDQAVPSGDGLALPAALIGQAPAPLAVRGVRQLIGRLNGGDQDCGAAHLEAVVRLCQSAAPSGEVHLPYGLTARREYDALLLAPAPQPAPLAETPLPLPGVLTSGLWQITCTAESYDDQPQGPWNFWLDRKAVSTLTLRPRKTGDRLTLAGRPTKSVKKWFIDEKVPRLRRDQLPVLVCGAQVAAVAGLGPAEAFLPKTGAETWHIVVEAL